MRFCAVVNATFHILAVLVWCVFALGGLAAALAVCKRNACGIPCAKKPESPMPPIAVVDGSLSFIVLPADARADDIHVCRLPIRTIFRSDKAGKLLVRFRNETADCDCLGQGDRLIV